MAAPFGPPPSPASTDTAPLGCTRLNVWRSISTRTTEPSGIATGPSGKRSPCAMTVMAGMALSPLADASLWLHDVLCTLAGAEAVYTYFSSSTSGRILYHDTTLPLAVASTVVKCYHAAPAE